MENSPTIFIVPTGIGCEVGGFAGMHFLPLNY